MIELHPNILEKDGKKAFVILSYEEFLKIQEELEDYEDLKDLEKSIEESAGEPTFSLDDVKKELGI